MKKSLFFAILAVMVLATGCSSSFRSMREPNVLFELNSHDYTLSAPVTGEATVIRVLGIDWARLFNTSAGEVATPIFGIDPFSSLDFNSMYAIYDLIEKNPGYDFVMYPQTFSKTVGFSGIYTKTDIVVTARLGKLK